MRILAAVLLLAILFILAGFFGYRLAGDSHRNQPSVSEEKWREEISSRDEQIARLTRDLITQRTNHDRVAKSMASMDKTNLASSPAPLRNVQPAVSGPMTMQNLTIQPTNGGMSINNLQGQPLFEINSNGNKVTFGTNIFRGPNGEIFINRAAVAGDLYSINSEKEVALTFKNGTKVDVYLYWINFQGVPEYYKTINVGEDHRQVTYLTHPWVIIDHEGTKLGELRPEKDEEIELLP